MAKIDTSGMAKIDIDELLKTYPREDVKELMVGLGIAYDLPNAESLLTLAPGKTTGDWIRVDEGEDIGDFDVETPA